MKIEFCDCSTAFVHIFASFVLLYNLIEASEEHKIFLMKYPEGHLDHNSLKKYFSHILSLCEENQIQLIFTTYSEQLQKMLKENQVFSFSN